MLIKWLDFADLHFSFSNADTENLRAMLKKDIVDLNLNVDFILMCGDFFYKGDVGEERIKECENFIHELMSNSGCDKTELYLTPGNHDLTRSGIRTVNINYYNGKELDEEGRKILKNSGFEGYSKLYTNLTGKIFSGKDECFERNGYRILEINTSILSGTDHDEGNISVYTRQLINKCGEIKNDDRINIAFMHHGIEFFRQDERKKFQQLMEDSHIDIVFSGHSHKIGKETYDAAKRNICQLTCGGPLKDDYNKPSFYYCIYDSDTHELKCYIYAYMENGHWELDEKEERSFENGVLSFELPRIMNRNDRVKIKKNQKKDIEIDKEYLEKFGIMGALPLKEFVKIRNTLIQEAEGDIILAGQSLENAFDVREDNESIVTNLKKNKKIRNIDIFLTDPIMFDASTELEVGDTPISRISSTMHTILYNISDALEKGQSMNIYFIPLVQLDHMVFVNDILLLRHTLLWTNDSHYKATPLICRKVEESSTLDRTIVRSAMYNVYKEYIDKLKSDSMVIEIKQHGNSVNHETLAKKYHRSWRTKLYDLRSSGRLKGNIEMHKLYRTQLISDIHSTWDPRFRSFSSEINWGDEGVHGFFFPDSEGKIDTPDKLYDEKNLLNDITQKMLLPYVKETERLLDGLVKKYDGYGEAHIFPSLDIGFPNNVLRLAGGFATGMLVVWKSGTPLVPVDTTVNVCSSSYYEFPASALNGRSLQNVFNSQIINEIITNGSINEGLAFSFNTGNHFLLLSRGRESGNYYLVLHSSAKQYKDSFLGLYPKPNNWYFDFIKPYKDKKSGRYINYLKDTEAQRFIGIARSLNEQNKDIHNWFAKQILGDIKPIQSKTYHHYGMPTDYSIAIGTYVVDEKDIVPIFSREGCPIFLFKVSSDMWSIELEGKRKYVVPHGWGQELKYEYFQDQITEEHLKTVDLKVKKDALIFEDTQDGNEIKKIEVNYQARFPRDMVGVRDLYKEHPFDGENMFGKTPYLKGTIVDILDPIALFSKDTNGEVKYYE